LAKEGRRHRQPLADAVVTGRSYCRPAVETEPLGPAIHPPMMIALSRSQVAERLDKPLQKGARRVRFGTNGFIRCDQPHFLACPSAWTGGKGCDLRLGRRQSPPQVPAAGNRPHRLCGPVRKRRSHGGA
jgi:hypothetical protein